MTHDSMKDFLDLEEPIANLDDMASVTRAIMERFQSEIDPSRDLEGVSAESVVRLIETHFENLRFCVYHLNSMSKALRRAYRAEPEAVA
jgi:hypothetical protein